MLIEIVVRPDPLEHDVIAGIEATRRRRVEWKHFADVEHRPEDALKRSGLVDERGKCVGAAMADVTCASV